MVCQATSHEPRQLLFDHECMGITYPARAVSSPQSRSPAPKKKKRKSRATQVSEVFRVWRPPHAGPIKHNTLASRMIHQTGPNKLLVFRRLYAFPERAVSLNRNAEPQDDTPSLVILRHSSGSLSHLAAREAASLLRTLVSTTTNGLQRTSAIKKKAWDRHSISSLFSISWLHIFPSWHLPQTIY
jgi:hypothetical protein